MSESPRATDGEAPSADSETGPSPDWAEMGRRGGQKSAETRRRQRDMSPDERARDAIARDVPGLINELLDAAHGRGDFEGLDQKTRLAAVVKAMEYGVGRPTVVRAAPKGDMPQMPTTADELFAD